MLNNDNGSARPQPANVLLITTDQQRYDTLGVTGNPHVHTPHLDQLASRGSLFRRGYIQNPVCMPSRACIQTGRYVFQHGVEYMKSVIGETPGLPPWERTVAERLQESGYHTAAFGKIHMMPPRGYDELQLTLGKGARWRQAEGSPLGPAQLGPVYADWLNAKRPGAYESIYEQRRTPEFDAERGALPNVLAADECVDHWIGENTVNFLDRVGAADDPPPFFAWAGFCGPHNPFDPPEPYASMYDPDRIELPALLHAVRSGVDVAPNSFAGTDGEALLRRMIARYWGMVTYLDDQVGRIMAALSRNDLWDDTLVIFTSDHGEMLGDFGTTGKANFHESVIRVPYLVIPPARSAKGRAGMGRVTDTLVEQVDLAPTILDYAAMPPAPEMPGHSLRPLLEPAGDDRDSTRWPTREGVLCEFTDNKRVARSKCLRTDTYKYVFHDSGRSAELYDLGKDPDELVNVAADPQYRDVLLRMQNALLERITAGALNHWNTVGAGASSEELDHFGRPAATQNQPSAK